MSRHPDERLAQLTELFASLPGIGPKSAARIVTDLLVQRPDVGRALSRALADTLQSVSRCPCCNTLTTEGLCPTCADAERDKSVICVVETPADQLAIESSVAYRGSYFVLMGRVNPMNGIGPKELGVDRLIARAKAAGVREIVIATSYTAEGETTAHMLLTTLKKHVPDVRVTRLARGLPAGIEIEFTDAATISAAILDRQAKC